MGKILAGCVAIVLLVMGVAVSQQNSPSPPSPTVTAMAEIRRLEDAMPKAADRGAVLFMLAKDYARGGDLARALAMVKECVATEEGFDPGASLALRPLRENPEFAKLAERVRAAQPSVHRARVAFTLPQDDLFPEGLAVDPVTRTFYMGSEHHKKIVTITEGGKVSDFFAEGPYHMLGIGGIKIDPVDHSVWAATDDGNESELVHFDRQGKLLERFHAPGNPPHVLNDLVLHGAQEIFVTDTEAHHVYRFDRKTHTFTALDFPRPLFEPNGITLSGDQRLLFVADSLGVLLVDLQKNTTSEISPGQHNTMAGVDGLYWYKGSLIGVEYGTGAFRVMRWRLSADSRSVVASEVLERGTEFVSDSTTGAILDGKFYYMANTGIENLENDKIVDPKKLEPLRIAVISLE